MIEYNNPFSTDFPFIQPSSDIKGKVVDAYVSYYDPTLKYKLPLRIASIRLGALKLVDAENNVLIDANIPISTWGNGYYIMQRSYDTDDKLTVAIIMAETIPNDIVPADGRLCLRCVHMLPNHVTSISVQNAQATKKNILLSYGNNTSLSYETDNTVEVRPVEYITIEAGPGLGDGKVQGKCEGTTPDEVYSINGVEVDEAGNIALSADDCISVSQTGTHTIAVRDDCTPCCECERFSDDATLLDNSIKDYYTIGGEAELIRDSVSDLVDILKCGDVKLADDDSWYYPVRCYIDTTWARRPAITAEFRNVMPAIVSGLRISVSVQCSPLCFHEALRTMYMADVTHDDIYRDTQTKDNYKRITGITQNTSATSNSWIIDWSDQDIPPGGTIWCTISARNGVDPTWKDAEPIVATATAWYSLKPTSCTEPNEESTAKKQADCIDTIKAVNSSTSYGTIKAGTAYLDTTGTIYQTYSVEGPDNGELKESIYMSCKDINGKDYKSAK